MAYICLDSAPAMENCVQVGEDNYLPRMYEECKRFRELIRKINGPEPPGARLKIKLFDHDFGPYYQVVVEYLETDEEAAEYAYMCEENLPDYWE